MVFGFIWSPLLVIIPHSPTNIIKSFYKRIFITRTNFIHLAYRVNKSCAQGWKILRTGSNNPCPPIGAHVCSTAEHENFLNKGFSYSVCANLMHKLLEKKEVLYGEHPSIIRIHKMNDMLKALSNKLPCRVGPWKLKKNSQLWNSDLIKVLPEDVDSV